MKLIQGISGIRGIVGETLTADILAKHVKAFSTIQGKGDILIARDGREHGKILGDLACDTIRKCSRNAQYFDIVPTPTAQFLVEKNKLAGGIVITASHNPSEWNGLKFIDSNGCFLSNEKNLELFKIVNQDIKCENNMGDIFTIESGFLSHIEHIISLSSIDFDLIQSRKFTVVVDAINGAASIALPAMLKALGCNVYQLNCTPNGLFTRGAEPLPQHLTELGQTVINNNADVGFATDPDGDRLAVVDETGRPLGEEYTLTICADGFLKSSNSKKSIVTNQSTTIALDHVAEKYGSSVIRSAVGEINVVNKMKECNALLGGEGNGGVILAESHYGRDSLVGVSLFLNRMAQTNETVKSIFKSMPQYSMIKDKIELGTIDPKLAIEKIITEFDDASINRMDGIKLLWHDSWIHVRQSNTEPIIRIYAEAPSKSQAEILVTKVKLCL